MKKGLIRFLVLLLVVIGGGVGLYYGKYGEPATLDQLKGRYHETEVALNKLPEVEQTSYQVGRLCNEIPIEERLMLLRDRIVEARVNELPPRSWQMRSINHDLKVLKRVCGQRLSVSQESTKSVLTVLGTAKKARLEAWENLAKQHKSNRELAAILNEVISSQESKKSLKRFYDYYHEHNDEEPVRREVMSCLYNSQASEQRARRVLRDGHYVAGRYGNAPCTEVNYGYALGPAVRSESAAYLAVRESKLNKMSHAAAENWLDDEGKPAKSRKVSLLAWLFR